MRSWQACAAGSCWQDGKLNNRLVGWPRGRCVGCAQANDRGNGSDTGDNGTGAASNTSGVNVGLVPDAGEPDAVRAARSPSGRTAHGSPS